MLSYGGTSPSSNETARKNSVISRSSSALTDVWSGWVMCYSLGAAYCGPGATADSAFIVGNCYASTCACVDVVYVEVAHCSAVEVKTDHSRPLCRNSRDVNVIRVWNKAG